MSKKEVTACTSMANITTVTRILRNSISLFGMISSIRYFKESGATKLAALLMMMSTRPISTRFLRGQIIVLKAARTLTFLLDINSDISSVKACNLL